MVKVLKNKQKRIIPSSKEHILRFSVVGVAGKWGGTEAGLGLELA
jgi:hypothetical protein